MQSHHSTTWFPINTENILVFSERELMFTFSICCRPSVCRLSVGNARAPYTQAVVIFGNISTAFGTLVPSTDVHEKFTEIIPGEPLRRGS